MIIQVKNIYLNKSIIQKYLYNTCSFLKSSYKTPYRVKKDSFYCKEVKKEKY